MLSTDRDRSLVAAIQVAVENKLQQFESIAHLQTVVVTDDIEAPSMFSIALESSDIDVGDLTWFDDQLFDIGNQIEIQIGYGNKLKPLISGEITGLEPEFAPDRPPSLTVRGHDSRHRLMRGQKTRSFTQMTISRIAEQVLQEAKLKAEVTNTTVKLDYVLQHNQTDLEFLQSQANRIGYELVTIDKTLHFRPQQLVQTKILTLSPEADRLEFSPRLSTLGQVGQVEVRGWNPREKDRKQQTIVGSAPANSNVPNKLEDQSGSKIVAKEFGQSSDRIVTQPIADKAQADQLAKATFNQRSLSYIQGEGSCSGRAELRAGSVIELVEIGRRFSGLYYVVSAVHTYDLEQGYSTQFVVKRIPS